MIGNTGLNSTSRHDRIILIRESREYLKGNPRASLHAQWPSKSSSILGFSLGLPLDVCVPCMTGVCSMKGSTMDLFIGSCLACSKSPALGFQDRPSGGRVTKLGGRDDLIVLAKSVDDRQSVSFSGFRPITITLSIMSICNNTMAFYQLTYFGTRVWTCL